MVEAGWKMAQCCIWVEQTLLMGSQDYHWQHEPILYGWKPGAAHRWFTDRKQTTVWNFDRPSRSTDHPTMKPVELISYPILNKQPRWGRRVGHFRWIGVYADRLREACPDCSAGRT
jgi:DNA modification methylase